MAQQSFRFTPEEQAAIDEARRRAAAELQESPEGDPAPRQQGGSRLGNLLAAERGQIEGLPPPPGAPPERRFRESAGDWLTDPGGLQATALESLAPAGAYAIGAGLTAPWGGIGGPIAGFGAGYAASLKAQKWRGVEDPSHWQAMGAGAWSALPPPLVKGAKTAAGYLGGLFAKGAGQGAFGSTMEETGRRWDAGERGRDLLPPWHIPTLGAAAGGTLTSLIPGLRWKGRGPRFKRQQRAHDQGVRERGPIDPKTGARTGPRPRTYGQEQLMENRALRMRARTPWKPGSWEVDPETGGFVRQPGAEREPGWMGRQRYTQRQRAQGEAAEQRQAQDAYDKAAALEEGAVRDQEADVQGSVAARGLPEKLRGVDRTAQDAVNQSKAMREGGAEADKYILQSEEEDLRGLGKHLQGYLAAHGKSDTVSPGYEYPGKPGSGPWDPQGRPYRWRSNQKRNFKTAWGERRLPTRREAYNSLVARLTEAYNAKLDKEIPHGGGTAKIRDIKANKDSMDEEFAELIRQLQSVILRRGSNNFDPNPSETYQRLFAGLLGPKTAGPHGALFPQPRFARNAWDPQHRDPRLRADMSTEIERADAQLRTTINQYFKGTKGITPWKALGRAGSDDYVRHILLPEQAFETWGGYFKRAVETLAPFTTAVNKAEFPTRVKELLDAADAAGLNRPSELHGGPQTPRRKAGRPATDIHIPKFFSTVEGRAKQRLKTAKKNHPNEDWRLKDLTDTLSEVDQKVVAGEGQGTRYYSITTQRGRSILAGVTVKEGLGRAAREKAQVAAYQEKVAAEQAQAAGPRMDIGVDDAEPSAGARRPAEELTAENILGDELDPVPPRRVAQQVDQYGWDEPAQKYWEANIQRMRTFASEDEVKIALRAGPNPPEDSPGWHIQQKLHAGLAGNLPPQRVPELTAKELAGAPRKILDDIKKAFNEIPDAIKLRVFPEGSPERGRSLAAWERAEAALDSGGDIQAVTQLRKDLARAQEEAVRIPAAEKAGYETYKPGEDVYGKKATEAVVEPPAQTDVVDPLPSLRPDEVSTARAAGFTGEGPKADTELAPPPEAKATQDIPTEVAPHGRGEPDPSEILSYETSPVGKPPPVEQVAPQTFDLPENVLKAKGLRSRAFASYLAKNSLGNNTRKQSLKNATARAKKLNQDHNLTGEHALRPIFIPEDGLLWNKPFHLILGTKGDIPAVLAPDGVKAKKKSGGMWILASDQELRANNFTPKDFDAEGALTKVAPPVPTPGPKVEVQEQGQPGPRGPAPPLDEPLSTNELLGLPRIDEPAPRATTGYDPSTYRPDLEGYKWMPQKRLEGTTDADWVFVQSTGRPFTEKLAGNLARLFDKWNITDPRQYIYLQKGRTYARKGQEAELRPDVSERLHPDKTDVWKKDEDGNMWFKESTHHVPTRAWGIHIRRHPDFGPDEWNAIRRAAVDADTLNPWIWLNQSRIHRREIKRAGKVVLPAYNPENIDAKTIGPARQHHRFKKTEVRSAIRRLQAERLRHLPPEERVAAAKELKLSAEEVIETPLHDPQGAPRDLQGINREINLLTEQLKDQDLRRRTEQELLIDQPAHHEVKLEIEERPLPLTPEGKARVEAADPRDWYKEPTAEAQHRDILGGRREPPSDPLAAPIERTREEIAAGQMSQLRGTEDDFLKLDDLLAREQDPEVRAVFEQRQRELIDEYQKPAAKLEAEIRGSIQAVADPQQFADELGSYENLIAHMQDLPDLNGLEKTLLAQLAERAKRMNGRGQSVEAKRVRAQRDSAVQAAKNKPLFDPNTLGALGGNIDWSIVGKIFRRYRGGIGKVSRAIIGPLYPDQATEVRGLTAEMGYGELIKVAEVQNSSLLADIERKAHGSPADKPWTASWKKLIDEFASLQKATYHAIQQGVVVDTVDNPAEVSRLVKGGKAEAQTDEAMRNMLMSQQHVAQAGLNEPYQQFMMLSTNLRAVVTVRQHRVTARAELKRLRDEYQTVYLGGAGGKELRILDRRIRAAKNRVNKTEAEWKRIAKGQALQGGYTPERSQAALRDLRQTQSPKAWQRIVTAADSHAKAHDQGLTQANEMGMISDYLVRMYRARGDYHTPFMKIANKTQAIYRLRQKVYREQGLIGTRVSQLMDNYYAAKSPVAKHHILGSSIALGNLNREAHENWLARATVDFFAQAPDTKHLVKKLKKGEVVEPGLSRIPVWRKGAMEMWSLPTDLARVVAHPSMLQLEAAGLGPLNILRATKGLVSRSATSWMPPFILTNAQRDIMAARAFLPEVFQTGMSQETIPDILRTYGEYFKAAGDILQHRGKQNPGVAGFGLIRGTSRLFPKHSSVDLDQFYRSGASLSTYSINQSPAAFIGERHLRHILGNVQGNMKAPRRFTRGSMVINELSSVFEVATKLMTYRRLINAGYEDATAAYLTRRFGGSPDFAQGGEWKEFMDLTLMFYNPAAQGMVQIGEAGRRLGRMPAQLPAKPTAKMRRGATDAFAAGGKKRGKARFVAGEVKRLATSRLAMAGAMTAAGMTALQLWNRRFVDEDGDPYIERLSPTIRDKFHVIFVPSAPMIMTQSGKVPFHILKPKPYHTTVAFGWMEKLSSLMMGERSAYTDPVKAFWDTIGHVAPVGGGSWNRSNNLATNFANAIGAQMNPAIGVGIDLLSNRRSPSGTPLIPARMQGATDKSLVDNPRVDPAARAIANKFGIAPIHASYILERLSGPSLSGLQESVGRLVGTPSDESYKQQDFNVWDTMSRIAGPFGQAVTRFFGPSGRLDYRHQALRDKYYFLRERADGTQINFDLRMEKAWDPDRPQQGRNMKEAVEALVASTGSDMVGMDEVFDKWAAPLNGFSTLRGMWMTELLKTEDAGEREKLQERIARINRMEFMLLQSYDQILGRMDEGARQRLRRNAEEIGEERRGKAQEGGQITIESLETTGLPPVPG